MWQINSVSVTFLNCALKKHKSLKSEKTVCTEEEASNMNCIFNEKMKTNNSLSTALQILKGSRFVSDRKFIALHIRTII